MLFGADISQLHNMLRERASLIVHFSGAPKGAGTALGQHPYPQDLKNAIFYNKTCKLSCSTVRPGDLFDFMPNRHRNATGCVGLLVRPRTTDSIMDVCAFDGGTLLNRQQRQVTLEDCEKTILDRAPLSGQHGHGYNEWNVTDYDPLGIFCMKPFTIMRYGPIPDDPYQDNHWQNDNISLAQIRGDFPGQRLFTFDEGCIMELNSSGGCQPIRHSSIYP